jgi:hypothetical protein
MMKRSFPFSLLLLVLAVLFVQSHVAGRLSPSSWSVPQWYLDPVSGNDTNDCQTSGTGCQTFGEIVARWGTYSPLFTASTNVVGAFGITQISTQTTAQSEADPIILTPRLSGSTANTGVTFTYQCSLPTPTHATTISALTAKNRTTNTGLNVGYTSGSTGVLDSLVCNTTTGKTSCSWAYAAGGGSNLRMTQPLVSILNTLATGFDAFPIAVEVDTWAIGDTVNIYSKASILRASITKIRPESEFMGANVNSYVIVNNCYLPALGNEDSGDRTVDVGRNVNLQNGWSDTSIGVTGAPMQTDGSGFQGSINWIYNGSFGGGLSQTGGAGVASQSFLSMGQWQILGGTFELAPVFDHEPPAQLNGVYLDDDFILTGLTKAIFSGSNASGIVQDDGTAIVTQGVLDTTTLPSGTGTTNQWWSRGTGILDSGHGDVWYATGTGGGAATFPSGTTLKESGAQVARVLTVSTGSYTGGLTVAAGSDLDTNLGSTLGCLCAGARGCFCNTGL